MDAFTSDELTRLRSRPQSFKPKLAVFNPAVVWSGTLNGAHAKGSHILSVTTVSGDVDDILTDTTLLIDEGIKQKRLRIRSAAGSNIVVSENPVDWDDGVILEAILLFEPHPVFNRIVNANGTITYLEDFDKNYVDENDTFSPVANIGPAAHVVEIVASGTFADLTLDATESFVFDSSISGYNWNILFGDTLPGEAEIIGSSTSVTATFRFHAPGNFYVSCTVSAANGKARTVYRPIMVRIDSGGQTGSPFFDFTVESLSGSRDNGFWSTSITVFEECSVSDFPRNVPVVIYGDVTYGSGATRSTEAIGWHYDNAAHQRFVGYVKEEAWVTEFRDKGAAVSFEAVGMAGLLDEVHNYPAWIRYINNPTNWIDMAGLSVDRMLYYYLSNRSTVLSITDWHRTGDDRLMNYAEIPEGSMYSGLREFLTGTIFADLVSDRQSALWSELDGQMLNDADRAPVVTSVHTLSEEDHMSQITIPTTRDRPEIAWISIDGLYFDGVQNVPRISYAPGYVVANRGGSMETISGLVLDPTQTDLNDMAGRLFAMRNNPYKTISLQSQGVYPYDIAPQASIRHGFVSGTFREETFIDADFILRSVDDDFFSAAVGMISNLGMEIIVRDRDALVGPNVPVAGEGVEGFFPPDITGIRPTDFGDAWDVGQFDFSWEDFNLSVGAVEGAGAIPDTTFRSSSDSIIVFNHVGAIYKTDNFSASPPTWTQPDILTDDPVDERLWSWVVDPFSPRYKGTGNAVNVWAVIADAGSSGIVKYVTDIFERDGSMVISNSVNLGAIGTGQTHAISAHPLQEGLVHVIYPRQDAGVDRLYSRRTTDNGDTWESEVIINATEAILPSRTPGIYSSPHNAENPLFLSFATKDTDDFISLYESSDGGVSWSVRHSNLFEFAFSSPNDVYPRVIHVPFNSNASDDVIYTSKVLSDSDVTFYRLTGDSVEDITPTIDSQDWYPDFLQLGGVAYNNLKSHVSDRNIMVAWMVSQSPSTLRDVFTSLDAGTTWFRKPLPAAAADPNPIGTVHMAVDDPNVFVAVGQFLVEYTENFGFSYVSKYGNLEAVRFPPASPFRERFVGLIAE